MNQATIMVKMIKVNVLSKIKIAIIKQTSLGKLFRYNIQEATRSQDRSTLRTNENLSMKHLHKESMK